MNTDKIDLQIRRRRTLALLDAKDRQDQLYEAHPALREMEDEKRLIASDRAIPKAERAARVAEKDEQIRAYMAQNGLTYPAPRFFCPHCQDTGFLVENGRSVRCSCFTDLLLKQNFEDSAADPTQTFDTFDDTVFDDTDRAFMNKLKAYCRDYCAAFPRPHRANLIFTGDTGCGKTFLLNCLFNELTKNGFGVVYLTAGRLFEILRSYAFQQDNKLSLLLDAQVLLIDDFGTEPVFNNITLEYMFMLINERTRRGRAICLSTNLTPDEIKARYTERISSRLFDLRQSAVFRLPGRDLRLKR